MIYALGIPAAYIILFAAILSIVWPQLDKPAIIAIVSVLGGGLAGVVGSIVGAIIAAHRVEKESETKIKEYASSQALELTKMDIELRLKEGRQTINAAAKTYREYYKALFELYETKEWPKAIDAQGMLAYYDFRSKEADPEKEDKKST